MDLWELGVLGVGLDDNHRPYHSNYKADCGSLRDRGSGEVAEEKVQTGGIRVEADKENSAQEAAMNILARLLMKFAVWVAFHRVRLEQVDLAGYFWVTVAWCNLCDQPINMSVTSCQDQKAVRACLEFHLVRRHSSFYKLRGTS